MLRLSTFAAILWQISIINAQIRPLDVQDQPAQPKPTLPEIGVLSSAPRSRNGFVQVKDGHFYLGNELFDFRGFK